MKFNLFSLFKKLINNQRLIPVIFQNQYRMLAEVRRWQMEDYILNDTSNGTTTTPVFKDRSLIVSLTSYGRRLYDVAYTIESIMRQTLKPNKIILWIDEADKYSIPATLVKLQDRGLEIRVTPEKIRSYKKLYHSLKEFPDDIIITFDDDIIYEYDLIERLVNAYKETPDHICAARCHRIKFSQGNSLLPYNSWDWHYKTPSISHLNFLTGVGGVLYPPHSLDEEVLNIQAFTTLAPSADDVWFYCMAVKKGTKIRKVATRHLGGDDYVENYAFHSEGLMQINTKGECLNDSQLKAVVDNYNLMPLLKD